MSKQEEKEMGEEKLEKETRNFVCKNEVSLTQLIKEFSLQNKFIISIYFAFLLIQPLQNALVPQLMSKLYQGVNQNLPVKGILYSIIFITVILQLIWLLSEYVEVKLQPKFHKFLMDKIVQHIFKINQENFNEQEVSKVITSINKFPTTCYNFVAQFKKVILPSLVGLIFTGFYLLYINVFIGFVYVCMLILCYFMLCYFLQNCDNLSYVCDQQTTHLYTNIDDKMKNLSTILNFQKSEDEIESISEDFMKQRLNCDKMFTCSLKTKYCVIPIMIIFILFSTSYFFKLVEQKKMESSKIVTIFVVNFMIMNTVFTLTSVFKDAILRMGMIRSTLQIFEECHVIPNYTETKADYEKGIQFKNVVFSRFINVKKGEKKEKRIFSGINLYFPLSSITLLMGKIGSGKSTIINLINKNQTLLNGNIFIDGVSIKDIQDFKNKVFYVPQVPILFNTSVYENIIYGIGTSCREACSTKWSTEKEISEKDVEAAFKKLGHEDILNNLADGVKTNAGLLGSNLSGGQKQIIWLIKLYFVDPEYILLDEPTSAMDEDSKIIVFETLKKLVQNKTVIMVTHDKYLKKLADQIIYLEDGIVKKVESAK